MWGGRYFFIQKQIKLALRIKVIHIQTICKCSIKRITLRMGRGLEVKALAEFSPGPNTNVLELRDLTLSSGKERK